MLTTLSVNLSVQCLQYVYVSRYYVPYDFLFAELLSLLGVPVFTGTKSKVQAVKKTIENLVKLSRPLTFATHIDILSKRLQKIFAFNLLSRLAHF